MGCDRAQPDVPKILESRWKGWAASALEQHKAPKGAPSDKERIDAVAAFLVFLGMQTRDGILDDHNV